MNHGTRNATIFIAAVIASLVLLNLLGLRAFTRFDVTREKVYTLSKGSRETMASLQDPVTVKAYFSENLPPQYAGNARYVRDLLQEYRAASKGQLSFQFIDPIAKDRDTKKEMKRDIFGRAVHEPTQMERELAQEGIQPLTIQSFKEDQAQTVLAYMGIVLGYQEKKEVIPVVQDTRNLEYDITALIRKMTRSKTPVIGVIQGHDEPKLNERLHQFENALSEVYQVRPLDLSGKQKIEDEIDAIMVVGPARPFRPEEMKLVDQFIMQGKSAGFFLDAAQVDLKTFEPKPTEHGLGPLLASYGITLEDKLVADVQSAQVGIQERRGFMVVTMPTRYPFVPILQRLEGDSPVSKGLSGITFPFTMPVSASPGEGKRIAVLAKSSSKSWLESKPFNLNPQRDWGSENITFTGPYNLMVQVSGKIPSHYASEAQASSAATSSGAPLVGESKSEARIIVAGSSSLFLDDFMGRSANPKLLLNVADWLLLDPALLAMRSRGMSEPPIQADLSTATRNAVKFGNILGVPLLLVLYGVVRWRMREGQRRAITI